MESIINSIRHLLDELEEEIQLVTKNKHMSKSQKGDILSDDQDEIKEYVKELITEISRLKEYKENNIECKKEIKENLQ
jgi:hypothetical protein